MSKPDTYCTIHRVWYEGVCPACDNGKVVPLHVAVLEAIEVCDRRETQRRIFDRHWNTGRRWSAIRQIYDLERPNIDAGLYEPYIVDWPRLFTPIELQMWDAIRFFGGLRLYPQYSVGRFFVDFGDPWSRIAIECDGAAWHHVEKDTQRDAALHALGWTVHRIKGRDCFVDSAERDRAFELLERIFDRASS